MEYAGKVTQRVMNGKVLSLYAYLAGGELYGYSFYEKQIFPYNKGIYFNLTIMVVETLRRYPHLNPN